MPVSVRYIVDDVEDASTFYRERLSFELEPNPGPASRSSPAEPCAYASPSSPAPAARPNQRPTVGAPSPAAGTASSSKSKTSPPRSTPCAGPEWAFAATSSKGEAATRFWPKTPGNPVELFQPAQR